MPAAASSYRSHLPELLIAIALKCERFGAAVSLQQKCEQFLTLQHSQNARRKKGICWFLAAHGAAGMRMTDW